MAANKSLLSKHLRVLGVCGAVLLSAHTLAQSATEKTIDNADFLIRQRDYDAAAQLLTPIAKQGNAEANYRLASLYQRGRGVKKSPSKAFALLRTACDRGHASGCQQLALLYEYGRGTERNLDAALKALTAAEAAGANNTQEAFKRLRQQLRTAPSLQQLQSMIAKQQLLALQRAIEKFPDLTAKPLDSGHTLLTYAISKKSLPTVELLLQYSDGNRPTAFGQPPLQTATVTEDLAMVKLLLDQGAAKNGRDSLDNCALHHAVRLNNVELVELLLDADADPNCSNQNGDHPRDWLDTKNQSMARLLTRFGAVPSPEVAKQETTEQQRQAATLDALQKLNETQFSDWPRLQVAAWLGSEELVLKLIEDERSADQTSTKINKLDDNGYSALARAAMRGHGKVVETLLKAGASDERQIEGQPLAMHAALRSEDSDTIRLLTAKSLDANWQSIRSLLMHCLDECSDKSFTLLFSSPRLSLSELEHRELGNLLNKLAARRLPLTTQLLIDYLSQQLSAEMLLKAINSSSDLGRSPLWWSLHYGEVELAAKIHILGGQLGAADHNGASPLHLLARIAIKTQLERFHPVKETIDQTDNIGNTPLMEAALEGNVDAIVWLTDLGAKVDMRNDNSLTALMIAAQNGHLKAVKTLIKNGANPRKRNRTGLTVVEQADKNNHLEITTFLNSL